MALLAPMTPIHLEMGWTAQAGARYPARYRAVVCKYLLFTVPGQQNDRLFSPGRKDRTLLTGQSAGGMWAVRR